MTTHALPRFDEIEHHPDDDVTAYTYFPAAESTMRELAQDLFGTHWRSVVVVPCIEVAFFERRGQGCAGGRSWGLRLWNGYGEQMTTVFLPNPWVSDDHHMLKVPDWSRLDAYYRLRRQFLGEPMPDDLETMAQRPLPETV